MMEDLQGLVAVITGAASGIGFALARGAQERGAKLVISDIRRDALIRAEEHLAAGGDVLAVQADAANFDDVSSLAQQAIGRFGKVNLLFNNAGVFVSGLSWVTSIDEYDWMIGVNQRSVINGIKAFVPHMIQQGDRCHVTTISSGAGITVHPGFANYSMTKHAVLALTEALYLDLASEGIETIGVTIVMPGAVQSNIMIPEKTSPDSLQAELTSRFNNPALKELEASMRSGVDAGLPADELADQVYRAIAEGELYVLPNFDSGESHGRAQAVGIGRAMGTNAYADMVAALRDRTRH